jgi:hypothetical protein
MWRSYPAPVPRLISPAAGRSRRSWGCGAPRGCAFMCCCALLGTFFAYTTIFHAALARSSSYSARRREPVPVQPRPTQPDHRVGPMKQEPVLLQMGNRQGPGPELSKAVRTRPNEPSRAELESGQTCFFLSVAPEFFSFLLVVFYSSSKNGHNQHAVTG